MAVFGLPEIVVKIGVTFAATATLGYCAFLMFVAVFAAFVVTCDYFNFSALVPPLFHYSNPSAAIGIMIMCWLAVFLVVAIALPQNDSAWNLLRSITLPTKTNKKAAELAIKWTRRFLLLQIKVILVETFFTVVFSILIVFTDTGLAYPLLKMGLSIVSKVIFGRTVCCTFVVIFCMELMESSAVALSSSCCGAHTGDASKPKHGKSEKRSDLKFKRNEEKSEHLLPFTV